MSAVSRTTASVALAGCILLLPGIAAAQTPWLMDYLSGWIPSPSPLRDGDSAAITLWGWFPYDCGQIGEPTVVDSEHVELTLRPAPPCKGDTTRVWHQTFELGPLHQGQHTLHVTRRFFADATAAADVAEAAFTFEVEPSPSEPPPSPPPSQPPPDPPADPDFPSMQARCLSGWYTLPANAMQGVPVSMVLWGWFPYSCGQISDAAVLDSGRVALTLRPGPACDDSTVTWSHVFSLGVLPPGHHRIRVDLTVFGDRGDTTSARTAEIPLFVGQASLLPPVPNPFVDGTTLSVTGPGEGRMRVEIFDLRGRRVVSLFDGPMAAGTQVFHWNCRRADGSRAPEGVYFSRITTPGRVSTGRLVLLPR